MLSSWDHSPFLSWERGSLFQSWAVTKKSTPAMLATSAPNPLPPCGPFAPRRGNSPRRVLALAALCCRTPVPWGESRVSHWAHMETTLSLPCLPRVCLGWMGSGGGQQKWGGRGLLGSAFCPSEWGGLFSKPSVLRPRPCQGKGGRLEDRAYHRRVDL